MDKKLIFRCFDCKKNYRKEINKELSLQLELGLQVPINFVIMISINLLCY